MEWLSAILKQNGHTVSLAFDPCLFNDDFLSVPLLDRIFSYQKKILDRIAQLSPKVILVSAVTDRYLWALGLAEQIKRRFDIPIVIGGIHVTSVPKRVMAQHAFDVGVIGEGDRVIVPLVRSLMDGAVPKDLPNLAYRESGQVVVNPPAPLVEDLDSLPFPDKELFIENSSLHPKDMYTTLGSRGCPYSCSFCNNSFVKSLYSGQRHLRFRSVDNVIEELEQAKEKWQPKVINFLDEVFASKPSWLREFAPKYKARIGIPFLCCTHPAVESKERVSLLKDAGCVKVDMGVQTLSSRLRTEVLHRKETTAQVSAAIESYHEAGITLYAENIVALPGETEADLQEMVRFYSQNPPATIKVFWLRYYPGTAIVPIGLDSGAIHDSDLVQIETGSTEKSITQGGQRAGRLTRQIYILMQLLPVLPSAWVQKILERRLYRFFPTTLIERFAYLVGRLINRQESKAETLMYRYVKHYRYYLFMPFRKRFTKKNDS